MLRAATRDAVELRNRQLELAEIGLLHEHAEGPLERDDALHRALAERSVANDEAASVILNRRRENLRSRRAVPVDQHHQRPAVEHRVILVLQHHLAAHRVADLHDRPHAGKKTGNVDRLFERSASIFAKIDDDALHLLLVELVDDAGHILRGAGVVRRILLLAFEVEIE